MLSLQSKCQSAALPALLRKPAGLLTIGVVCIVLSVYVALIVLGSQAGSLGHGLLQGMPLLHNLTGLCL